MTLLGGSAAPGKGLAVTLPTFLGIGVPRAGTTWLHDLLDSHPEVYVPSRRKEVHFFDRQPGKGLDWYAGFFPDEREARRYEAIGEITPHYLYDEQAPDRILEMGSVDRFLVVLRDPVDRAYSEYGRALRDHAFDGSFETFLDENPWVLEESRYADDLRRYVESFGRDRFLVLLFDEMLADVPRTKRLLADFLDVDADGFPHEAGDGAENESYIPRARRSHALAMRVVRFLRHRNLDWPVNAAKRMGLKRLFGRAGDVPDLDPEVRQKFIPRFEEDIEELEPLLDRDLSRWQSAAASATRRQVEAAGGSPESSRRGNAR